MHCPEQTQVFPISSQISTPNSKAQCSMPKQEQTADKDVCTLFDQTQNIKIRNQIFSLFKNQVLRGHIKVQNFESLQVIEVMFYHKIETYNVQQNIKITFNKEYPRLPPKLQIHSCNLTQTINEYIVPNFLTLNQLFTKEMWNQEIKLADVLAKIYQNIDDFHKSQVQRLLTPNKSNQFQEESCQSFDHIDLKEKDQQKSQQKHCRQRRKSSNMTGCADKELTETKNLNRHFRSKLREVLRDLTITIDSQNDNSKFIDQIFTPNRVGFEDIRKALSNKWFNQGVRRQMNSGQFLHKILRGMMGIKSKKLMIKYYHVMVSAVQQPNSFIRWKYD